MDSTRWRRLKALFDAALEQPEEERVSFLDEACAGDPALRQELDSLLLAAAVSGPFDALADEFVSPLLADLEDDADLLMPSLEGRRVGPYEIVRRIGQGGMGAVYLAERADGQFEQQVALKLVRHGLHGTEGARRFLAERQILARLQHPHIARLLDGGITADGQPYFAMEVVDGLPLDDYCDAHDLGIEARLQLFQTVCDAVHYAHQNLIVHRDLKPSNILVTASGTVKLLDFGIAKLVNVESEGDLLTRTGVPVLTPAYASPEQVRCQSITTASDVYTLGVVLFELLTGQRPYDVQGCSPSEIEQIVCETEPPAPSTVVTRPAPSSTSDAPPTRASGSPEVLRRRLAGDLDTIILKAMQKEPGRRYASVEALRDDLQRHLDGLPVTARPSTLGYQVRTFVRRHRTGVTAAALVALAVLAGVVGTAWQAHVAAQERDAAHREAAKAERVASFMIDVFETPDPSEARGDTITAREILDRGAQRVRTELAAEPVVQAQMMDVIGRVYQNLGLYDEAQSLLREALVVRRGSLGPEHRTVATSLDHLASLRLKQGDYAAADSLYRQALAHKRRHLPSGHPEVAASLNGWALVKQRQGDYAAGDSLYRQALGIWQTAPGDHRRALADAQANRAQLLQYSVDYDLSDSLYREALATRRALLGDDHPDVALTLNNWATMLYERGDYATADSLYRQALTLRQRLLGEDHPDVAATMNNLALVLEMQEQYDEAEALYEEALALRTRHLGRDHPDVVMTLNNMGVLAYRLGDYDQAAARLQEVVALQRRILGPEHVDVGLALNNLAGILRAQGDYAAAETRYREAIDVYRATWPKDHPYVSVATYMLGAAVEAQGRLAAAERHYRQALAGVRATTPEGHPRLANVLLLLGDLLVKQERPSEALPYLDEAVAVRKEVRPEGHWEIASAQLSLGRALTALGRYADAERVLQAAYATLQDSDPPRSDLLADARAQIADLYAAWGRPEQAEAFAARTE